VECDVDARANGRKINYWWHWSGGTPYVVFEIGRPRLFVKKWPFA
jgi:hypothetical protein